MSHFALDADGRPIRPTSTGQRGTCMDPACAAVMIAKCGDFTAPHWAHTAGTSCALDDGGETGWHMHWKYLFQNLGAAVEVAIGAHRADVELADKRIVEIQSRPLRPAEVVDRERTYGDMAWIYRVDPDDYDIADEGTLTNPTMRLTVPPRRSLIAHERPVYWHLRAEEVVRLVALANQGETSEDGAKVWSAWVEPVAVDWLEFAEAISKGEAFGAPPQVYNGPWFAGRAKRAALIADGGVRMVGHLDDVDLDAINNWCNRAEKADKAPRIRSLRVVGEDDNAVARLWTSNPKCSVCGQPMVAGQGRRGAHYSCRPDGNQGDRCTCHPNPNYRQWVIDNVLPFNPTARLPEPCAVHGTPA